MNKTVETAKHLLNTSAAYRVSDVIPINDLVAFIREHGIQAFVNDAGMIQALEVSIGPKPHVKAKPFQVTERWVELPARLSVIREWLGY